MTQTLDSESENSAWLDQVSDANGWERNAIRRHSSAMEPTAREKVPIARATERPADAPDSGATSPRRHPQADDTAAPG